MATAAAPQFIEAALRRPGPLLQKYEHSVIDVAVAIHDSVVGSGDPLPEEKARELVRWLHWRVNYAWDPTPGGRPVSFYDESVRLLGLSAVDLAYHPGMGFMDPAERPD